MKKILFICLMLYCTVINATSLHSPYPSVLINSIELNYLKLLSEENNIEMNYYISACSDFSIYPLIRKPAFKIDTGVQLSIKLAESNFYFNVSSGVGILINPFFYKDKLHDMDLLIINSNRLSLGYRFTPLNNIVLEPYIGGNFDLSASTKNYYGVMPWLSLKVGLKIII